MVDFIDSRKFARADASNLTEVQLTGLPENGSQRRLWGRPIRKLCERGANLEVLHLGDFKLSEFSARFRKPSVFSLSPVTQMI